MTTHIQIPDTSPLPRTATLTRGKAARKRPAGTWGTRPAQQRALRPGFGPDRGARRGPQPLDYGARPTRTSR